MFGFACLLVFRGWLLFVIVGRLLVVDYALFGCVCIVVGIAFLAYFGFVLWCFTWITCCLLCLLFIVFCDFGCLGCVC